MKETVEGIFWCRKKEWPDKSVRPNFDKTPYWFTLTQRRTGADHAPAMNGMPAFFAAVLAISQRRMPKHAGWIRFQLPGQHCAR
jgi:hypothetical protein